MSKCKEVVFHAASGDGLIVRYRKSAVYFERQANVNNVKMKKIVLSWRNGPVVYGDEKPHFQREEISRTYAFHGDVFVELVRALHQIGLEAWSNFEPKVADSIGADYDSYWDRDHEDEGGLSLLRADCTLFIEGPFQVVSEDGRARLYKFSKRKFESLVFDLQEQVKRLQNNPKKEKVSLFD